MGVDLTRTSKFLALVLRHDPAAAGITLDGEGWADVGALLAGMAAKGHVLSGEQLRELVAADSKGRYALSGDGGRIRAVQGHSIDVELNLKARMPPAVLFHGTATRFREAIKAEGLLRRSRRYVHLSADRETAVSVGQRHGKPWVIEIDAARMHAEGVEFFLSENGVWLVESVPARYFL
jgi:putative RNA 2'-phosphotransferase